MIQEEVVPAPKFTRPLQNQTPKPEGANVKLEAQVKKIPPPFCMKEFTRSRHKNKSESSAIFNFVLMLYSQMIIDNNIHARQS